MYVITAFITKCYFIKLFKWNTNSSIFSSVVSKEVTSNLTITWNDNDGKNTFIAFARSHSQRRAQGMDITGLSYSTLSDYTWVSSRVKISVRTEKLSWTHHKLVARFWEEPDVQTQLLDHALCYRLSTRQFKRDIQDLYPETDTVCDSTDAANGIDGGEK